MRELQSANELPPWERSWFYCAPGGRGAFLYLIAIHLITIVGLVFFPLPSVEVIIGTVVLAFLGALGTTVAYHRALCHRAVKLNFAVEQILIFFSIFNGGGTPRSWVSTHRVHHQTADTAADVSSPHFGGFWWSHVRWIWQTEQVSYDRYCPELNKPRYAFWDKVHIPILIAASFFGLFWGWGAWVWLGPLRMVVALHGQFAINSVCHLGDPKKSTSRARGSSINVWWLTPFMLGIGENWHANHHEDQMNPRLGVKWYQVDMGWWTIRLLQTFNLATVITRQRASALAQEVSNSNLSI